VGAQKVLPTARLLVIGSRNGGEVELERQREAPTDQRHGWLVREAAGSGTHD